MLEAVEASAPGVIAILWVDDFIILLPRPENEEAVRSAFAEAIRDAICEPSLFKLRQGIKPFGPKAGFPALGYNIRLCGSDIEFAPTENRARSRHNTISAEVDA